jgi:hypothetical protein
MFSIYSFFVNEICNYYQTHSQMSILSRLEINMVFHPKCKFFGASNTCKKRELHTTHGVAIKSQCPSRRLHKFPFFSAPFNKRLGVIDPISTCPCYSNLLIIETNKLLIIHIFCLFTITDTYSMCIY